MSIFFTSDTHFCHNRDFIYSPRGFSCIEEHDETIVERWNSKVKRGDTVYHLGDVILMDTEKGLDYLKRLNGNIIFLSGNHDTKSRKIQISERSTDWKTVSYFNYDKYSFYLSHYITLTSNFDSKDKPLYRRLINLHGHTHQKSNFAFDDNPCIYHVGLDSHNCYPVDIEEIIEDIKKKAEEYK